MTQPDPKAQELAAMIRGIRDRVRTQYPDGEARGLGVPLPDLLPILQARDAAEAKVAAIGSVNPRPAGIGNSIIQWWKRQVARSLGWFVRDQVEFNRAILNAVEATLESMNEVNRTFVAAGGRLNELSELRAEAAELRDIRMHWLHWHEEWERKISQNEIHFLRSASDLQAWTQHRMSTMETTYRESMAVQHGDFNSALADGIKDVQQRVWGDLQRIREEYERLIHFELRLVRQRLQKSSEPAGTAVAPAKNGGMQFDYARFAERFRGTDEYVRNNQRFYLPWFAGKRRVLDIGCGRGEFLELMKEAGVPALGIDLDGDSVALCRSKGLEAETADLFTFLAERDGRFDGIFAAQVVEHLPPERLPEMIKLCAEKLEPGGVLALETPNPECLAIFATHFYLDPTHTRPIPPQLMVFYFEEFGLGRIEVHRLAPAVKSMPSVGELPQGFQDAFFASLDYSVIGKKL